MIEAALIFLKTFWRPIAAALILLAAWWWHSGQVREALEGARAAGIAETQARWDAEKAVQTKADAAANQTHRATEGKDNANVITAQGERAQTVGAHAADFAGLRTERDRLRSSLTTALDAIRSCNLPGAATDAAAQRAAAVARVLEEMEGEAAELARAADAHAADSLMYQRAWPQR